MECSGRQRCDNTAAERRHCDGREYLLRWFYSTRERACATILYMTGAQSNGWQYCDNAAAERRYCDGRKHSLRRFYSTRERACTTILCMTAHKVTAGSVATIPLQNGDAATGVSITCAGFTARVSVRVQPYFA